jgi:hypothetical protein
MLSNSSTKAVAFSGRSWEDGVLGGALRKAWGLCNRALGTPFSLFSRFTSQMRLLFQGDGSKALADEARVFDFVEQGEGVILGGNVALTLFVSQ